jgi:hypothetical protein
MAQIASSVATKPLWVDLSSSDPAGSRDFYAKLLGWSVEVDPNPLYGGYALAKVGGKDVAGIGPKMMAEAPTAWTVYVGTADIAALTAKVVSAGGIVIAPSMQIGDQGSMAVFQDPTGAYFGAWQPASMTGFEANTPGGYDWAELNARGLDNAVAFYRTVFGWEPKVTAMADGQPPYTEFLLSGESIAGGMEINPMMPPEVPSYWMVYFSVPDVDVAFKSAIAAGAKEMLAPMDYPGGRFGIMTDPQGATFGLLRTIAR